MNRLYRLMALFASALLMLACSPMAPIDFNPDKLAYAVLDHQGKPTLLCFDTISPNHCVRGGEESMIKHFNLKKRILLQHYILIIGEPTQIDCKLSSPHDCRVYFEHIYVDITIEPEEFNLLKQELKDTEI